MLPDFIFFMSNDSVICQLLYMIEEESMHLYDYNVIM